MIRMLLKDKYTIVMPIKRNNPNNHGSTFFEQVGLKTFEQFLDTTYLDRFIIVCPEKDINHYFELLATSKICFDVIGEEHILNDNLANVKGWYKQQLIKLSIHLCVNTPIYLTIDSDMYLNQMLSKDDLIHNNKFKYSSEPWQTINNSLYSTNSNWWLNSAKILDIDKSIITCKTNLMSVTPQILVTKYVAELIEHLFFKYKNNWQRSICDMEFTEFTLYWLFCIIKNYTTSYTTNGYPLWTHDKQTNTLEYVSEMHCLDKVRESFIKPTSIFSVIQGYLNMNLLMVEHDLSTSLEWSKFRCKKYDSIILVAAATVPTRNQSFTQQERFEQTIETVKSAKQKIPNSYTILIEGNNLPIEYTTMYDSLFDDTIYLGNDKVTQTYVNDKRNIGHGESFLLQKGIEYIIASRIKSKKIIKLGARYKLNNQFNIDNFKNDKYTFRQHFDDSINSNVFTTGLFSIPFVRIEEFRNILSNLQFCLSNKSTMVEKVYFDLIKNDHIHLVDNLGLEGRLSYNKTLFIV